MHLNRATGSSLAARLWFVLAVTCASVVGSSAADECELASLKERFIRPTSQFAEFRIILDPPDYGSAEAVRRHFTFSSTLASILQSGLAARSQRACEVTIESNIFPDLRAFLVGYRTAQGQNNFFEVVCVPLLRDIVHSWTPDETTVAEAVADLLRWPKWPRGLPLHNSSFPFDFTDNVLRTALTRIYDEKSVMHSLVSVDVTSYKTLAVSSFFEWIGQQRSGRLNVTPLSTCPTRPSPLATVKRRIPAFPLSGIASAGVISIPFSEVGTDLPVALQHVVVIGDDRPPDPQLSVDYAMSPYAVAVKGKYCGQRHMIDIADNPSRPTLISASIKCQFATILSFDDWMLLFCEDCATARAAEAFAKVVINDPDLRAAKDSETDIRSKGPYLISFAPGGK
jgi:hypothetical protein